MSFRRRGKYERREMVEKGSVLFKKHFLIAGAVATWLLRSGWKQEEPSNSGILNQNTSTVLYYIRSKSTKCAAQYDYSSSFTA